ncbi:hypothetical protein SAMN06269185_0734 [Natronoarchaeum philippinense]|uniref:DUF7344 domain-containing protein n=2 Tax=Natronoarchaeum philippinense TaxID=558529 RepID=A0A285N649_NATPI|nr:hypothetical protein SAMN06269185_0734 [Natronoarchaeum philippinense]
MNDNAFEALANEHRRTLLLDLLESNPQYVATNPPPSVRSDLPDAEQQLRMEMYHLHLPLLVDYGFIEWDKDTNEITTGPQFEEVRPLLEVVH